MRSFAKNTFGSTRVGRDISFLGWVGRRGADDMVGCGGGGGGGEMRLCVWEVRGGRCELRFNGCGYWWGVWEWGRHLWLGVLEAIMAVRTGALIDLNMYKQECPAT